MIALTDLRKAVIRTEIPKDKDSDKVIDIMK